MSFREYLIENEQAAKLVELGKRKRAELQNLQNARQRGDIDTAKYWNSAQMNTQKEIEKIKTAMTKPKRADSKKASDEIEVVHGWKTNPEDKTISITHAGETKTFNKKKDAIHHLLDKGLSAADVGRKGFSALTVQGAKADWKDKTVGQQKNEYIKANPQKNVQKSAYVPNKDLDAKDNEIVKRAHEEIEDLMIKKPENYQARIKELNDKIEGYNFRAYLKRTGDYYG